MTSRRRTKRKSPTQAGTSSPLRPSRAKKAGAPTTVIVLACLATVVAVVTLATHWPVLSATALSLDDDQYLTKNRLVQNPSWDSARRFLVEIRNPSTVEGYYQPLAMISLMVDSALGGTPTNLGPYHRTSLVLHIVNTVFVVMFLYQLFGSVWAAAVAGLLFGIHPITVEPVAWISDRKTLLAAFFSLAALIQYVGYTRSRSWVLYGGALLAYVAALLSKPTSTTLPFLLLLLDFWPLRTLARRQLLDKLPFLAVCALSAAVTLIGQGNIGGVILPASGSILQVPVKVCYNTVFYVFKLLWPVHMSGYYVAPEPFTLSNSVVQAGMVVGGLLAALIGVSLRWTRSLFAGCAFFFVTIIPTIGVIGFALVNASDKYAYLPMVGLLLPLADGLRVLGSRAKQHIGRWPRQVALAALLVVVVGVLGMATRRTLTHWRDTETLFRYMIRTCGRPSQPHIGLANHLAAQGRLAEAVEHYEAGIRLEPGDFEAISNLALSLGKLGRLDEAIVRHEQALRMQPENARLHSHLAFALAQKGNLETSIREYREAIRLGLKSWETHFNLAVTLLRAGRCEDAIRHYEEAVRIEPGSYQAHLGFGQLLLQQGRFADAEPVLRRAGALNPRDPAISYLLAQTLERLGRTSAAIEQYRHVLGLMPTHTQARERLRALGVDE
jgi:tetratricopeptide (TPR) repeat protein